MNPKVLFVAAEAIPLAKTGGLGDVVSALAATLQGLDVEVTILLPAYPEALSLAKDLETVDTLLDLPGGNATLLHGSMPDTGVPVLLLRNDALYERSGGPYLDEDGREYPDNATRFAALSQAGAWIASGSTRRPPPRLVHAHDWHAALVPLYMRQRQASRTSSVLTIHNLAFQGNFPLANAAALGIHPEFLGTEGVEFWGQMSFMKAGLQFADGITTVSESYAEEILTPQFGCGLEGLLMARREHLVAVPNGIDTMTWDPKSDPLIAANFSENDLKGKATCKRALQQTFGLQADPFAPVLALGSRLTEQKMADVALTTLAAMMVERPRLQVAVLGTGEGHLESRFLRLALEFPARVGVHIGYDERTAHGLHAGADMLLHGSRFEPFGLTPVYAMRYGTVPIASRVGGLRDSIVDRGSQSGPAAGASGFLFDGEDAGAMTQAVRRALDSFDHPRSWRAMQRAGMAGDHGWHRSAKRYLKLYDALSRRAGNGPFYVSPDPDDAIAESLSSAKKCA